MAQGLGNKKRLIAIIVAVLVVVCVALAIFTQQSKSNDSSIVPESSEQFQNDEPKDEAIKSETEKNEDVSSPSMQEIDPSTVSSIDIQPLDLTVSYVKGIPGFEYQILRTAQGTRYVEFTNDSVKGTKCTDDTGVFASIIAGPNEAEVATLDAKTVIEDMMYGLSLASDTCTNNQELLGQLQDSFSNAFPLLKKIMPLE